jgi:hypothetical protein
MIIALLLVPQAWEYVDNSAFLRQRGNSSLKKLDFVGLFDLQWTFPYLPVTPVEYGPGSLIFAG